MTNSEGRVELAFQAYQRGQFSSLRAAARMYDVSHATLTRQYHGIPSRSNFTSPNRKLTTSEESALVDWILSMDTRGMPPTQALVRQMAEILLAECVQDTSTEKPDIGKRWVLNFLS